MITLVYHEDTKGAIYAYAKHLDGDIWELRPINDRILFTGWVDGAFVLLHSFIKKHKEHQKRNRAG